MKLSKPMAAVLVAALTILAVIVCLPSLTSSDEAYEQYLKDAREFSKNELYQKAMMAYEYAVDEKDSLEIRVEMADTYMKGLGNGEFDSTYSFTNMLYDLVDAYRKDPKSYETALKHFQKIDSMEDCVQILYQAEDLKIESKKINELREKIRYSIESLYGTYPEVTYTHEGSYLIKGEDYILLNGKGGSLGGAKYEFATPMLNGYALVKLDGKAFLISSNSVRQAYYPDDLTDSTGVGDSLVAIKVGEKYTYYDLNGKKAFGKYDFAGRFANGVAPVKEGEKWYLIGTDGKKISDKAFEDIKLSQTFDCSQTGLIFAKADGVYKLYDCKLKEIGKAKYEDADVFVMEKSLAAVKIDGKWGFVDASGKIVIKAKYEDAKSFSCGLAGVKDGEFWSFINTSGEKVITGEFDDVNYFNSNGYCFVKSGIYWNFIVRNYNR